MRRACTTALYASTVAEVPRVETSTTPGGFAARSVGSAAVFDGSLPPMMKSVFPTLVAAVSPSHSGRTANGWLAVPLNEIDSPLSPEYGPPAAGLRPDDVHVSVAGSYAITMLSGVKNELPAAN